MCDGGVSITTAKVIDDMYGIDVFCFTQDTIQNIINSLTQLHASMVEEKLDALPENPSRYEDSEDDYCCCDEDEDEDYNVIEMTYAEGPNT